MAGETRLLVLGGGAQGRVIATDLASALPRATVTVADLRDPGLAGHGNLRWREADLADASALVALIAAHDLVVGALPSSLGFAAMRAAIAARRPMVDVSFCAEDSRSLDAEARRAGVTVIPDCGLAPGLSHLCVGFAAAGETPDEVIIDVGGVADDPLEPYGYVVTWSLGDLEEEYRRPARIVREGKVQAVPALSELTVEDVPGGGPMEVFLTDGLRTLLETLPGVPTMVERTLRWPGHVAAIRPLLDSGRLIEELGARCRSHPPRDLVVLRIRVRRGAGVREIRLVDRYDPASGLTAMARTTALTTSACAQIAAEGGFREPGVHPLENIGRDPAAFRRIVERLGRHHVHLVIDDAGSA
jgi:saccharopine dehydrogenase-like NADP-dependent oxidoreductase